MKGLRENTMGKLVQQFMKFGVVGVIAFVIDYGLMVALTERRSRVASGRPLRFENELRTARLGR